MLPLLPGWLESPESKVILWPLGDQSGSEAFRRHGVRRLRPLPSIPIRKIAEVLKSLKRLNTTAVPSGENWGSESKSTPAGIFVSRRASSRVTPSGSEEGMIQIPCRARLPQSALIASLVAFGAQPGLDCCPSPLVSWVSPPPSALIE